jgi:hypothetical protein
MSYEWLVQILNKFDRVKIIKTIIVQLLQKESNICLHYSNYYAIILSRW